MVKDNTAEVLEPAGQTEVNGEGKVKGIKKGSRPTPQAGQGAVRTAQASGSGRHTQVLPPKRTLPTVCSQVSVSTSFALTDKKSV
ncbi:MULTISPECIES: hypothetical protein [Serratia]|uniref:hypothetical protein n=1 Tax=Serratia TaxID=613 RepID=UPI0013792344|nr:MULTISPECIES: hypothetical protein [Serratia]